VVRNSHQGRARLGLSLLAASMLLAPVVANAAIVETAKVVSTTGQYSTKNPLSPSTPISGNVDMVIGSTPGFPNELGIDVFATAEGSSFFFQNSLWRIGEGSAFFDTVVETTLTNTGDTWETLVFDSMITPGYLAVAGKLGSGNAAKFDFRISQVTGDETQILYSAFGVATAGSKPLVFSPTPFFDLTEYSNEDTLALTWGATKVSLLLNPIAPGSSTKIIYDLQTYVTGPDRPVPGDGCQGSQVSFGDPRNPGGAMRESFDTPPVIAPCSLEPVIGRRFDPTKVPATFTSVPEPTSWAMLISGFGLTGAAMRRRRAAVA
jgi:PEP-CTERM motif